MVYWVSVVSATALLLCAHAHARPTARNASSLPVAIWHGLGDRYDSPGLTSLADDIKKQLGGETFVYMIRANDDGAADSKASLFGNMDTELDVVAEQLKGVQELKDGFNVVGLSQGGVFLRGYVERYNTRKGYPKIHNLITLGSPHMGISSAPPCHPTDFFCKATQWALRTGVWTPYAQSSVVPAQYFRNQAKIEDYLSHNSFLRDINNERWNDTQPVSGAAVSVTEGDEAGDISPRNATYKKAIAELDNLVLFAFSHDITVIPSTSPHFTLPSAEKASVPLPWSELPLYEQDYIGLRELDGRGGLHRRTCQGVHMEIDEVCWNEVITWLGGESVRYAKGSTKGLFRLQGP